MARPPVWYESTKSSIYAQKVGVQLKKAVLCGWGWLNALEGESPGSAALCPGRSAAEERGIFAITRQLVRKFDLARPPDRTSRRRASKRPAPASSRRTARRRSASFACGA